MPPAVTTMELSPLHEDFGVEVRSVDLTTGFDTDCVGAIEDALHAHGLLLFREQNLEPQHLTGLMGKLCVLRSPHGVEITVPGYPEIAVMSNIVENGRPIGFQHKLGIEWHTDGTGWQETTLASCIYALEVPGRGGDTLFAGMCAAYEALPPAWRDRVDDMHVVYSRAFLIETLATASGIAEPMSPEEQARFPDVVRPLVRTHPVTGRRAALLSIEECRNIVGLSQAESRPVLEELIALLTGARRVYRHRWQVGDLIVWDNRCMLHSPTEYTYPDERRRMHRIIGLDPAAEKAATAENVDAAVVAGE